MVRPQLQATGPNVFVSALSFFFLHYLANNRRYSWGRRCLVFIWQMKINWTQRVIAVRLRGLISSRALTLPIRGRVVLAWY